uniref:Ketoacyl_synth_N domain-containing protein n=1 Tax=Bursaphelenchus xylophilus TaxID=6326 RepID=A0A1I7RIL7_BURXY
MKLIVVGIGINDDTFQEDWLHGLSEDGALNSHHIPLQNLVRRDHREWDKPSRCEFVNPNWLLRPQRGGLFAW